MKAADLKAWRDRHGMSQIELAKLLGMHVVTIARWETDARAIPALLPLALRTIERERLVPKRKPK
jgi:transcriptional regulator with XRE-family HTH domain